MGLYLLALFIPCFTLDNNNYAENSGGEKDILNPYISLRDFHIWYFQRLQKIIWYFSFFYDH